MSVKTFIGAKIGKKLVIFAKYCHFCKILSDGTGATGHNKMCCKSESACGWLCNSFYFAKG